jgi:hypothetical protein
MTTSAAVSPLERAAELYDEYVEIAEISTLAELASASSEEAEPMWYGSPPAGLVLSA